MLSKQGLLLVVIGVAGCQQRPGADELARLRAEAEAENQQRAGSTAATIDREIREWTLTIEGQVAAGTGATLTYAELDALATAFNTMSTELDRSFKTLRGTVAAFERFVPQKFLHVIAPEGIDKIKVGTAAHRTMTILFTDIRGYTSLSETIRPAELFDQLNEYLARVAAPIGTHGGFIDKYIGDAIMARFDDPHTPTARSTPRSACAPRSPSTTRSAWPLACCRSSRASAFTAATS